MSKTTAVRAAGETLTQRQIVTVMVGVSDRSFMGVLPSSRSPAASINASV